MISNTHKRGVFVAAIVLLAVAFGCTATVSAANWTAESTPVAENLNDVVHTSDGVYAVGTNGVVLNRTSEGWQTVINDGPASNGNNLYGAGVTDDGDTLWFVGASGAIGEYDVTNGSLIDHTGPNGATHNFRDVAVRNNSGNASVYISDSSGHVHYSFNNGGAWNYVTPGSGNALPAIDFHSLRSGHSVDTNQKVFATSDGSTWNEIGINDTNVALAGVDSNAADDVWVTSDGGTVFDYNGTGWNSNVIAGVSLNDIEVDSTTGYIAGGGGAIFKHDNGNWTSEATDTNDNLQAVTAEAPRVAVGDSGTAVVRNTSTSDSGESFFDAIVNDVNGTVQEGEDVVANYTITNTGSGQGTQDIGFTVNGTTEDTQPSVTLNQSEEYNDSFTYTTISGDVPEVDVAVQTENDSATSTVNVENGSADSGADGSPRFTVSVTDTNSPVEAGETVKVYADIVNEGNTSGTQQVELEVDNLNPDGESVTLASGEEEPIVLHWNTGSENTGDNTVFVNTNNDSAVETVTVTDDSEPATDNSDSFEDYQDVDGASGGGGGDSGSPDFQESNVTVTTEDPGQELSVAVEVKNTGTDSGNAMVQLRHDGEVLDSTEVSLYGYYDESGVTMDGYSHETVYLSTNPEPGEYKVTVNNNSLSELEVDEEQDSTETSDQATEEDNAEQASQDLETSESSPQEEEGQESEGEESWSENMPGFTVAMALASLLVVALYARMTSR